VGEEAAPIVPDQLLAGEPARALHEGSLALTAIAPRLERPGGAFSRDRLTLPPRRRRSSRSSDASYRPASYMTQATVIAPLASLHMTVAPTQLLVPFSSDIHAALASLLAQVQSEHPVGKGAQTLLEPTPSDAWYASRQNCVAASHWVTSMFAVKSWYMHGTLVAPAPLELLLEELLADPPPAPLELLELVAVQAPPIVTCAVAPHAYCIPFTHALVPQPSVCATPLKLTSHEQLVDPPAPDAVEPVPDDLPDEPQAARKIPNEIEKRMAFFCIVERRYSARRGGATRKGVVRLFHVAPPRCFSDSGSA